MAKTLNDLLLKRDENGREIRCLIVKNQTTGGMSVIRDEEAIKEALESDHEELTKIYEPTQEEREGLLELVKSHLVIDELGETSIEISEEEVLLAMMDFTDIEINKRQKKANLTLMKRILKKPNVLFEFIKQELETLLIEVINLHYTRLVACNTIVDNMNKINSDLERLENQVREQERQKLNSLEEINELEKSFNELMKMNNTK